MPAQPEHDDLTAEMTYLAAGLRLAIDAIRSPSLSASTARARW